MFFKLMFSDPTYHCGLVKLFKLAAIVLKNWPSEAKEVMGKGRKKGNMVIDVLKMYDKREMSYISGIFCQLGKTPRYFTDIIDL